MDSQYDDTYDTSQNRDQTTGFASTVFSSSDDTNETVRETTGTSDSHDQSHYRERPLTQAQAKQEEYEKKQKSLDDLKSYINMVGSKGADEISHEELIDIHSWPAEKVAERPNESYPEKIRRLNKNILWRQMRQHNVSRDELDEFKVKFVGKDPRHRSPFQPRPKVNEPPKTMRNQPATRDLRQSQSAFGPYARASPRKNFLGEEVPSSAERFSYGSRINQFLAPSTSPLTVGRGRGKQQQHHIVYYDPNRPNVLEQLVLPPKETAELKAKAEEKVAQAESYEEPVLRRANAGLQGLDLESIREYAIGPEPENIYYGPEPEPVYYGPELEPVFYGPEPEPVYFGPDPEPRYTIGPDTIYYGPNSGNVRIMEGPKQKTQAESIKEYMDTSIDAMENIQSRAQSIRQSLNSPPGVQRESTRLSPSQMGASAPKPKTKPTSPVTKEDSKKDHLEFLRNFGAHEISTSSAPPKKIRKMEGEEQRPSIPQTRAPEQKLGPSLIQPPKFQNTQPPQTKQTDEDKCDKIPQLDGNDDELELKLDMMDIHTNIFGEKKQDKEKDPYYIELPEWLRTPIPQQPIGSKPPDKSTGAIPKRPQPKPVDTAPIDEIFNPTKGKWVDLPWEGRTWVPDPTPEEQRIIDGNRRARDYDGPETMPDYVAMEKEAEAARAKDYGPHLPVWRQKALRVKRELTKMSNPHNKFDDPSWGTDKPWPNKKSDLPDHMILRKGPIQTVHGQVYRDGDYLVRQKDPPLPRAQLLDPFNYHGPHPEEKFDEYGYPMKKEFEYEQDQKFRPNYGPERIHLGRNWKRMRPTKDNRIQLYPEDFPYVKVPENWNGELYFSPQHERETSCAGIFSVGTQEGEVCSFFGPNIYKPRNRPRSRDEVDYWVKKLEKGYPEGWEEPLERKIARTKVLAILLRQEENMFNDMERQHWALRTDPDLIMTYGFQPELIRHPDRTNNVFYGNMGGGEFVDPHEDMSWRRYHEAQISANEREAPQQPQRPKSTSPTTGNLKMLSTQEQQLKMIQEKCASDISTADTNQMMLDLIQHVADGKPNNAIYKQMCWIVKDKIRQQLEAAKEKDQQIVTSKYVAKLYDTKLEIPLLATGQEPPDNRVSRLLEAYNVMKAIKPYNPDNPHNSTDFSDTWRHVISYTRGVKLTEEQFIGILLLVLQGPAHKIAHDMSNNNNTLRDILDTLSNLYCKKKTVLDDMAELKAFKRRPNEPIMTAMSRARLLVEKIKHIFPPMTWVDTCDRMLTTILKQIVDRNTRNFLQTQEMKNLRIGVFMDYSSALGMVETYEATNDCIPKEEIATTVNVCSGMPISMESNSKSETDMLQEKVNKLESMLTDININAIDPKDRRSAKERSKSRDSRRSLSREKKIPKIYENQLKAYKKLEDESNKMDTSEGHREPRSSRSRDDRKKSYSSGHDKRREKRYDDKKERRESKSVERYLSSDRKSRDKDRYSRDSRKSYRPNSRSSYRSSSNYRSNSRPRSSSYRSNYSSRNSSYNRSSERPRSRSKDYKSKDYKRSSSYDSKYEDKKRGLNKSYSKENFKKHDDKKITDIFKDKKGNIKGFTVNHVHYYQCPSQNCNTLHPQNYFCEKAAKN